ncbi:MAG: pregnancy-associated plasma protein-A, partial [Bacteroidota bacterium]|nr:pregnancy-associated plasma protein-A [Bacteroidota bacterium]
MIFCARILPKSPETFIIFRVQYTGMKKIYAALLISFLCQIANAQCGIGQSQVIVTIVPDLYPQETSWSIHDGLTGALIDTGLTNSDTICIASGRCINFTIFDAYGDGICCAYGTGSYIVTLSGDTVAKGGQFGHFETTYFNCPPGHDCSIPLTAVKDTMTAPHPETWYIFTPDSTGIYNIGTCDLGNTCDTKIYIYDHCDHLLVVEDNTGTTFYNDDGCLNYQSFISAAMPAGHIYYIRIGDYDTSCAGHTINWQIQFAGPIRGCTDTASCNYNPLATVSDSSCVYPPSPLCPAPDLAVDQDLLRSSMYSDNVVV